MPVQPDPMPWPMREVCIVGAQPITLISGASGAHREMITTVQQHIRHQQQNFAEASGTFSCREIEALQSLIKEAH